MPGLWKKSGKVVVDANRKVIYCPQCPCEEGTGTGDTIDTPCCGNDLPEQVHATVSGGTSCLCANPAKTVYLIYNPSNQKWEGSVTFTNAIFCGGTTPTLNIAFYCNTGGTTANDFRLDVSGCSGSITGIIPTSAACSPLNVAKTGLDIGATCCPGTGTEITVTITL